MRSVCAVVWRCSFGLIRTVGRALLLPCSLGCGFTLHAAHNIAALVSFVNNHAHALLLLSPLRAVCAVVCCAVLVHFRSARRSHGMVAVWLKLPIALPYAEIDRRQRVMGPFACSRVVLFVLLLSCLSLASSSRSVGQSHAQRVLISLFSRVECFVLHSIAAGCNACTDTSFCVSSLVCACCRVQFWPLHVGRPPLPSLAFDSLARPRTSLTPAHVLRRTIPYCSAIIPDLRISVRCCLVRPVRSAECG
jgi:hypothetical protein